MSLRANQIVDLSAAKRRVAALLAPGMEADYMATLDKRYYTFTNSKAAWLWLAEQYAMTQEATVLPARSGNLHSKRDGLCLAIQWMGGVFNHDIHMISESRMCSMQRALFARFEPCLDRGELLDGFFFWTRGDLVPRI